MYTCIICMYYYVAVRKFLLTRAYVCNCIPDLGIFVCIIPKYVCKYVTHTHR
jgi:hypothetical protein